MRIKHRMKCRPSCRISAVKVRRVREDKRGKEEGRRNKTEKMVRGETKVTLY